MLAQLLDEKMARVGISSDEGGWMNKIKGGDETRTLGWGKEQPGFAVREIFHPRISRFLPQKSFHSSEVLLSGRWRYPYYEAYRSFYKGDH